MKLTEESSASLSREELYALVWVEPMLKVAARFGVSSSYMARVCSQLQVPRPERGYWAKLEVGKAPATPALPQLHPGAPTIWIKGGQLDMGSSPLPVPPEALAKTAKPARVVRQLGEHALIEGARAHFESGRLSYEGEYLKPAKETPARSHRDQGRPRCWSEVREPALSRLGEHGTRCGDRRRP
jgi:hypothetical protein